MASVPLKETFYKTLLYVTGTANNIFDLPFRERSNNATFQEISFIRSFMVNWICKLRITLTKLKILKKKSLNEYLVVMCFDFLGCLCDYT